MAAASIDMNPKKVRAGLALVAIIFVASAVLVAVADGAVSKAIFFAIACTTLLRCALLVRWLRRERAGA